MTTIEELYQMYFKDVYLYVKAISKSEEIAEEITQETFFKALKGIKKFKGNCDIRVWLCQIAKNSLYTYAKKMKRTVFVEPDEDWLDEKPSIETTVIEQEQIKQMKGILEEMQEPYRGVFSLRIYHELSFREIAKVYGKTESWARVTYYRAKEKIIQKVEKEQ